MNGKSDQAFRTPTWPEGGNGSDSNCLSKPGELATPGTVWGPDSGCAGVNMSHVKGSWEKHTYQ